jgi:hypothetical protein
MRLDQLMLLQRQLQPLQHDELVDFAGLAGLVLRRRCARHDEILGAKRLELDGIGTGLPRGVTQAQGQCQIPIVVDAGFGDDEHWRDGCNHGVPPA